MEAMTDELSFQSRSSVNRGCFGLNIQRAARVTAKKFDDAFRPLGINHWQFAMLMALNVPNGLSVNELARSLVVDRTTITANVKPLERGGLLTVRVDQEDARSRRIELTSKGSGVIKAAFPIWEEVNCGIGASLGDSMGQEVLDGLALIIVKQG
jgi:DNA-binding MarR family transcriptional regulator